MILNRAKTIAEIDDVFNGLIASETPISEGMMADFMNYKWRLVVGARTEAEWMEWLKPIDDKQVRAKVASILWWDYASNCPKIFPLMLQYHRFGLDDCEAIFTELVRIGYPEKLARKRSKQPRDSHAEWSQKRRERVRIEPS